MPRPSTRRNQSSNNSILRYLTGPNGNNSTSGNPSNTSGNGRTTTALSEEFVNESSETSTLGSDHEELDDEPEPGPEVTNNPQVNEDNVQEDDDQFLPDVNMRIPPVLRSPDKANGKKSILSQLAEELEAPADDKENNSKNADDNEKDDEDDAGACECSICFEQWTNAGPHRLVALKCGHLFGLKCIKRWIKAKTTEKSRNNGQPAAVAKCPQCNAVARKNDIRLIYAKKLSALDVAELDRLQKSVTEERAARSKSETKLASVELQLSSTFRELQRCQDELKHWKALYEQKYSQVGTRCDNFNTNNEDHIQVSTDNSLKNGSFKLRYSARISAGPDEQCRKLVICPRQNMIITSLSGPQSATSTPNATTSNSHPHGLVKISVRDLKWQERIPNIHSNQIRDLCKHPDDIGMILSTGWDQKMKITDVLRTNSILYSFNMESKGWSCCWSQCKNVALSGLANSSIIGHDIRMPNSPLIRISSELFGGVKMKPVHTMEYVNIDENSHGLLIAHYDGVYYVPYNDDSTKGYGPDNSICLYKVPQVGLYQCTFAKFIDSSPDRLVVVGVRSRLQIQHLIIKFPLLSGQNGTIDICETIGVVDGGTAKVISKSAVYQTKPNSNHEVPLSQPPATMQEHQSQLLFTFNEQKKKVLLYDIFSPVETQQSDANEIVQVYQEMNIPGHSPVLEFEQWNRNGILELDGIFALDESTIGFYEYLNP